MKARWVFVGLLALAAAALVSGCAKAAAAEATQENEVPVVSPVDEGVIAEAVIEPARSAELLLDATGKVSQVLVAEGDEVAAGAPLVRLDTEELEISLQSAQQEVVAQRAALDQLRKGTSPTVIARADKENAEQIAQAEIALQMKQLQLEKAQTEDPAAGTSSARAKVEQLKLELERARAQDPAPDVKAAQVELERAGIALDEVRDEYTKALDRPWEDVKVRDALAKQLRQAELNYQLAQSGLDRALGARRANTIGFATLEIQLADAQEQLEQAVAAQQAYGVTLDTLAAEIEAARLNLESLRSWENPYQDKATEEEIAQAEARLRQAEMAVAKLELQAGDAELDAPFAGTVVDVRVEPGDLVNPGQVVVLLAALDQLQARTVDLTELDIARVSLGQPVAVRVDALPDRELAGTVSEIGLQGKDYRGDVVYDVKIELVDAEAPEVLRWGMTAMVEIAAN